jgi:hypothetical protein
VRPSALAASARAASALRLTMATGLPFKESSSPAASNTQTSARPVPGAVSVAELNCGWFGPRNAAETNARLRPVPANTMSRGSSPTSSVRSTRGVPSSRTTLTESERWFTTQTSSALRSATATGSRPTETLLANRSESPSTA